MFCKSTQIVFVLNRIVHISKLLKVFIEVIMQLIKLETDRMYIVDQIRFGIYRTSLGEYKNQIYITFICLKIGFSLQASVDSFERDLLVNRGCVVPQKEEEIWDQAEPTSNYLEVNFVTVKW